MKIVAENTPLAEQRKPTLPAAIAKFRHDDAELNAEYAGRPYDARFAKRARDLTLGIEAAITQALPFRNIEDVVAALELDLLLLEQTYEGTEPQGLDAARLTALRAAVLFLAKPTAV